MQLCVLEGMFSFSKRFSLISFVPFHSVTFYHAGNSFWFFCNYHARNESSLVSNTICIFDVRCMQLKINNFSSSLFGEGMEKYFPESRTHSSVKFESQPQKLNSLCCTPIVHFRSHCFVICLKS